ncbi:MAG: PaaI family thioesterase [Chloroflexi bacterium]|nr:PaaI family thioesterase [Chloroflexota bacterium]
MNEQRPNPWAPAWLPDEQPPAGQRLAFHRLAAAIRRMNELLLDSDMPEDELLAAAEAAERFADRLADGPRGRPHWGFGETSNAGNPRAFFDSSPLIGLANPVAPPLRVAMEGGEVTATCVFGQQYEGPPGHCHGGFVAAAFDEVLGMAQSTTGHPGMTGTLAVKYRQPTPLYAELRFRGRVDRVEGKKIFASATLHHGERLCAEAEGVFVSVDPGRFQELAARGH